MDIIMTSEDKGDHLMIRSAGTIESKEDLFRHSELVYQHVSKSDQRKILIDAIHTLFPADIAFVYEQVDFFSKNLPEEIRLLKIAIVVAPEFSGFGKFWEIVAESKGYNYHSFISLEKARTWLLQEDN